ncbi:FUN14 domain-containing protein [Halosolutus gelatinilyticus]|uniref:FUN14 domain-containing protein n=1 Tax=Halosolutus gelatinilyticus TaxID=2931975 RepID=UPI001FF605DF|nr:FUN14 domain-containing protein [Halosolutus gelatinilyticus]
MIDVDPTTLSSGLLAAAALGGCLGFGTKRLAKPLAIILAIELMIVRYLESVGIVAVDWRRLAAAFVGSGGDAAVAAGSWAGPVLSVLSIGVGFVGGFLIGYHRG